VYARRPAGLITLERGRTSRPPVGSGRGPDRFVRLVNSLRRTLDEDRQMRLGFWPSGQYRLSAGSERLFIGRPPLGGSGLRYRGRGGPALRGGCASRTATSRRACVTRGDK